MGGGSQSSSKSSSLAVTLGRGQVAEDRPLLFGFSLGVAVYTTGWWAIC